MSQHLIITDRPSSSVSQVPISASQPRPVKLSVTVAATGNRLDQGFLLSIDPSASLPPLLQSTRNDDTSDRLFSGLFRRVFGQPHEYHSSSLPPLDVSRSSKYRHHPFLKEWSTWYAMLHHHCQESSGWWTLVQEAATAAKFQTVTNSDSEIAGVSCPPVERVSALLDLWNLPIKAALRALLVLASKVATEHLQLSLIGRFRTVSKREAELKAAAALREPVTHDIAQRILMDMRTLRWTVSSLLDAAKPAALVRIDRDEWQVLLTLGERIDQYLIRTMMPDSEGDVAAVAAAVRAPHVPSVSDCWFPILNKHLERVESSLQKDLFLENFKKLRVDRARTRLNRLAPSPSAIAAFEYKWADLLEAETNRWDRQVWPLWKLEIEKLIDAACASALIHVLERAPPQPFIDFYGHEDVEHDENKSERPRERERKLESDSDFQECSDAESENSVEMRLPLNRGGNSSRKRAPSDVLGSLHPQKMRHC